MADRYIPQAPHTVGEFTFFADFENATADFEVRYEAGNYTVAPASWLHFAVRGVSGKNPTFRVKRADHVDERRRFVWSPDGDDWHYFGNVSVDDDWYYFEADVPFESNTVYVAGLFPYRLSELEELLYEIGGRRCVSALVPRGFSPDRRPIYGLRITDPDIPDGSKSHLVVMAGVHAWEAWGRQVCHGFVETVTSDDPDAVSLRKAAIVHVYPMANPDGVVRGFMKNTTADVNPNRVWYDGAPPEGDRSEVPEVDLLRRAIVEDTGGTATYFVDLHSHAGRYDRCMWYADEADPAATELVAATHDVDKNVHDNPIIGTDMLGGAADSGNATSKRWAERTLGATGLTFEATPYSSPTRERYRRAGDALVAGFDTVLD